MEGKNNKIQQILLKALFIILIVILIVILAFAVIRFIPVIFSSFASVGSMFSKDKIEVSVNNNNLMDGDEFVVFWKHNTEELGTYKITYPCKDYLKLDTVSTNNNTNLLCNTAYQLPTNTNSIELKINVTRSNVFIDLPITISFVNSETQKITSKGEVSVTVKNISNTPNNAELSGSTITTTETVQIDEPVTTAVNRLSPADLYIYNVIAIDDQKIVFTIGNRGGINTGNWYFSYDAPGLPREISPIQPSLRPGTAILYTLIFDGADEGIVRIYVDSTNLVNESIESNNIGSVKIDGGNRNSSYSYNRNDDADFDIVEMEVGRMSGSRFIEDDQIDENDDAAVRFIVVNKGGEYTDDWRFEITDTPYNNGGRYRSPRQDELAPGESVEIIVEFENPDGGRYDIEVEVDSEDDTDEENERNNKDSERLRVND